MIIIFNDTLFILNHSIFISMIIIIVSTFTTTLQVQHYDPKQFDIPKGFFPFRDTPFYVSADKAKDLLGFEPKHASASSEAPASPRPCMRPAWPCPVPHSRL